MSQQLFRIDREHAVNCNPGGRLHGWLFKLHADGETWVSVRKLDDVAPQLGVTLAMNGVKPNG